MRTPLLTLLTMCALSISVASFAQPQPPAASRQPRPTAPPAPPPTPGPTPAAPAPPAPRRENQPVNVKVEVTITDQRGGTQTLKKTVTVVTGDGMTGFIRSSANYSGIGVVPLNIDVEPFMLSGPSEGKIRLRVNLQYTLPAGSSASPASSEVSGAGMLRTTDIHESLSLILESGKTIIAAQSADPVGDRQVTIEVKATTVR
jgi:hypothetical protein